MGSILIPSSSKRQTKHLSWQCIRKREKSWVLVHVYLYLVHATSSQWAKFSLLGHQLCVVLGSSTFLVRGHLVARLVGHLETHFLYVSIINKQTRRKYNWTPDSYRGVKAPLLADDLISRGVPDHDTVDDCMDLQGNEVAGIEICDECVVVDTLGVAHGVGFAFLFQCWEHLLGERTSMLFIPWLGRKLSRRLNLSRRLFVLRRHGSRVRLLRTRRGRRR